MITLAALLLALALADLVAGGLGGEPAGLRRVLAAISVAALAPLPLVLAFTTSTLHAITIEAVALGGSLAWLGTRGFGRSGNPWRRPLLALGSLGTLVAGGIAISGFWRPTAEPWLLAWLESSPFGLFRAAEADQFVLFVAVVLFLSAPANAVVRAALTAAGTEWRTSQNRLRGGRLIGVLERWLIFVLAVNGELTAASLIISAKSLLRFPELSRVARSDQPSGELSGGVAEVDVVTEYFLLGSLVSWTLALAPAMLFWG